MKISRKLSEQIQKIYDRTALELSQNFDLFAERMGDLFWKILIGVRKVVGLGLGSLIDAIVKHGQAEYVHAQAESLAYLVWLKKFAQAFLKSGGRD